MRWKYRYAWDRMFVTVLSVLMIVTGLAGFNAFAKESQKTIRVGRFPYEELLRTDEEGNYTGYGYDYLREIAQYTGWHYEFVDATWDESLAMLERGELDLIGAVMRSPDREEQFDFCDVPMISGYGMLATPLDNQLLPYEDFSAFEGLSIGATKGNLHADTFLEYSAEHGFTSDLHLYHTQGEMEAALETGEIDAIISTNILRSDTLRAVATFAENDAYFVTTKGNSNILKLLNEAMRQIRLHDPYFNSKLNQKYFDLQASTAVSFTREELDYIQNSDPIPCTYLPLEQPFNAYDKATGAVQGVAIDVCSLLEQRTGLTFQWIEPTSPHDAVEMLRRGEVLLLPAKSDNPTWAYQNDIWLTAPYLQGQMVMVNSNHPFSTEVVAQYDEGFTNPAVSGQVQIRQYANLVECMDAVLQGEATTTYINSTFASYFINNPIYSSLHTTVLYGKSADHAMAVSKHADPMLLSVLNKGLRSISDTELNQFLLLHMKQEKVNPFIAHLHQHPGEIVLLVACGFAVLIAMLLVMLYRMYRMLYMDQLTGYGNFRWLSHKAQKLMGGHVGQYAVIYMDIRRFKVINDTFGYETGDRILIATADTLQALIQKNEGMARIHSDIFVLLLHYQDHLQLQERVNHLSKSLEQLFLESRSGIVPLFRGGVYPLSEDYGTLDQACDRANYAKESIRHLFSNTFVFYDDVIHSRILAEKELENSMNTALARHEFVPYYQPKVNAITNQVMGAEALVRWHHPDKGCLSPGVFIPFYEENGFIVKIDLAIFEQVCRDLQQWRQEGREVVPVSVNFSRRNIQNKDLPQKLYDITVKYDVPATLLEIEMTETEELENTDIALEFVKRLKEYGFTISIDDYGTGYSSISFLQQLPMDVLKLDRQFTLNAMQSDKARDIMHHLISAMEKNQIRILCEGIENKEQLAFVISLNCRFIQGFLYSRPLPKEAFEAYLSEHGVDGSRELDFIPIVDFNKSYLVKMEDFLTRTLPSWILSCFVAPGYPISFASSSMLAALGYSELEFQIATDGLYVNAVHPEDLPQAESALEQHHISDENVSIQYRLRKKDGGYLWIREVNRRILTEEGREALLGICTDITDIITLQKEKEQLIEAIPGGVGKLLFTGEGPVIQQASDRFYQIIGHSEGKMKALGNHLFPIFCEEQVQQAKETMQHMLEAGETICNCKFRIRHGDGTSHWISFFGSINPQEQTATVIIRNCDDEMKILQDDEIGRAKLALALSLADQAVFEYDIQSNTIRSHSGFSVYGVPDGAVMPSKEALLKLGYIHPDDTEKIYAISTSLQSGKERVFSEFRIRFQGADTAYNWIRVTMSAIPDENGRPLRAVGVVENISKEKHFEYAFQQEAQFRESFTESSLMAYEINLSQDTIERISGSRGFILQEFCSSLPQPIRYSDALAATIPQLVAADDQDKCLREMSRESLMKLYQRGVFEQEVEYRRLMLDGQVKWTSVLVHMMMDQLSGKAIAYAYHRDIHDRKVMEQELLDQAEHDPLTRVFNRVTAEHRIRGLLSTPVKPGCIHALLMMDLDRFKAINDSFGHLVGDNCLVGLADILRKNAQPEDIIGRMGGDEFLLFLVNQPDEDTVHKTVATIMQEVREISGREGIELPTGVSIGIALVPQNGTDFETLYRHADKAMYLEKPYLT